MRQGTFHLPAALLPKFLHRLLFIMSHAAETLSVLQERIKPHPHSIFTRPAIHPRPSRKTLRPVSTGIRVRSSQDGRTPAQSPSVGVLARCARSSPQWHEPGVWAGPVTKSRSAGVHAGLERGNGGNVRIIRQPSAMGQCRRELALAECARPRAQQRPQAVGLRNFPAYSAARSLPRPGRAHSPAQSRRRW